MARGVLAGHAAWLDIQRGENATRGVVISKPRPPQAIFAGRVFLCSRQRWNPDASNRVDRHGVTSAGKV